MQRAPGWSCLSNEVGSDALLGSLSTLFSDPVIQLHYFYELLHGRLTTLVFPTTGVIGN